MRLSDQERKLLAILRNYNLKHSHMPSLRLLQAKTGRNEAGIHKVLRALSDKGHVDWTPGKPVDSVDLVRAWEDPPLPTPAHAPRTGSWWEALADERSP